MKIRFLKASEAMQNKTRFCCDICGHVPTKPEMTWFEKDEEADVEEWGDNKIDLRNLKFNEDYIIIEYP